MKNAVKRDANANAARHAKIPAVSAIPVFAEAFAGYSVADKQINRQSGNALLHKRRVFIETTV